MKDTLRISFWVLSGFGAMCGTFIPAAYMPQWWAWTMPLLGTLYFIFSITMAGI